MLFSQLCKSNRRRILLNPASKFFNPRMFRHDPYGMLIIRGAETLVRPKLSVTVSVTA
jgi:hypothetical protein